MQAFGWNASFETGIGEVDAQHRKLVELTNAFGEAVTGAGGRVAVDATFLALADYAREHFTNEEGLMKQGRLDERAFQAHRKAHEDFLSQVALMRSAAGPEEGPRVLMTFLVSWIAFHILGTDRSMARQLAAIARGAGPADAYAAESSRDDTSARLVFAAIDDLLRVVAERNQQLSDANASLEQRVADRTRELATALADLKSAQLTAIETAKLASVGQLASGLAHEINNPLAFLGPNITYLAEASESLLQLAAECQGVEPSLPDAALRAQLAAARERTQLPLLTTELPQVVKETMQGLARVRAIVRDMRDFSSVEYSGLARTDLNYCLDTVLAVLPANLKGQAVIAKEYGPPASVRCVVAPLNQTLLALLTNALQAVGDAAPRPGTVMLQTGESADHAWAEIVDTGVGMTREVQAHLFEPFFTTRAPGQGFGLGLSAAWKFAHEHGGTLEVKSQEGEGTRVKLTLPKAGPASAPEQPSAVQSYNALRK